MLLVTHSKTFNTWNRGSLNGNKKLCKTQQMTLVTTRLQTAFLWGEDNPGNHQAAAKPDLLKTFPVSERQPMWYSRNNTQFIEIRKVKIKGSRTSKGKLLAFMASQVITSSQTKPWAVTEMICVWTGRGFLSSKAGRTADPVGNWCGPEGVHKSHCLTQVLFLELLRNKGSCELPHRQLYTLGYFTFHMD